MDVSNFNQEIQEIHSKALANEIQNFCVINNFSEDDFLKNCKVYTQRKGDRYIYKILEYKNHCLVLTFSTSTLWGTSSPYAENYKSLKNKKIL